MDPNAARQLVEDDAYSSRGINYNPITSAAEERLLFDAERQDGDDRDRERDDEDDGMAWEPSRSPLGRPRHSVDSSNAGARHSQGSFAQLERDNADLNSPPAYHHRHQRHASHHDDTTLTSLDKRKIRVMWWRAAAINCIFIAAWYTFSTCISVYNKWMFSADHYDFPYPLFVTSCHMLVQWILAGLTLTIFPSLRSKNRPPSKDYISKVAPCGMATGLDIGLSNLSLRTITLSFYTMCKSSSLAFVLLFAFIFKLEKPTWKLVGIITIITAGVILMVSTETQFELAGMIEVLTASALGGLRWSLTQILLDKESMGMSNPIATLFWLAPVMGLTLSIVSMSVDGWGNVLGNEKFFGNLWLVLETTLTILIPGCIAFCMNVTEFGLIQRTSVVTLSVAGILKEVGTIFLSTVLFHDQLTPINISGLCVSIFGIALYNYLKYLQFTKNPEKAAKLHGHGFGGHGPNRSPPAQDSYDEDAPMLSPRARHAALVLGAKNDSAIFLETLPSNLASAPHHSLGADSDSDSDSDSNSSSPSSARTSIELPSASRNPFVDAPVTGGSASLGLGLGLVDSTTVDASSSLHLHRQTREGKRLQHEHDVIPDLRHRIGLGHELDDAKDERGRELALEEREFENSLQMGLMGGGDHGHDDHGDVDDDDGKKNETDEAAWDLLGEMDEDEPQRSHGVQPGDNELKLRDKDQTKAE